MKVAFTTLGCRVNQYETEAMSEKFIREGYQIVTFEEIADVYVINTCTVTNSGDKKSRQMIGRARRKNENAVVAVVGCYSQIAPEDIAKIEGVNLVLGTRNKGEIVHWINRVIEEKKQIIQITDVLKNDKFEDLSIEKYQDKTRAFLKIQDGCNRFCSYCLIPFARGAVCSKEPEKIIKEVKELAQHGFKEIILSGIHIASYGVDLKEKWDLVKILQEIDSIEGIERIRIGSIDPQFFSRGVIEEISKLKKLCPHFHLSLQSGCDETLIRMNRRYTTEEYRSIVKKLREHIKDVSITTDIIVGFPGETEEEFKKTYEFLKEIQLSKMHVFKFSPREGTKAAMMKNTISGNEKEQRSHLLIKLDNELEEKFMTKFIGRSMEVLLEKQCNELEKVREGYTPNYMKVVVNGGQDLSGGIYKVVLNSVKDNSLMGEIIPRK